MEFELVNFDTPVQHFSHYTIVTHHDFFYCNCIFRLKSVSSVLFLKNLGDLLSVMVIIIGNGIDNLSSNSG